MVFLSFLSSLILRLQEVFFKQENAQKNAALSRAAFEFSGGYFDLESAGPAAKWAFRVFAIFLVLGIAFIIAKCLDTTSADAEEGADCPCNIPTPTSVESVEMKGTAVVLAA